MSMIGSIRRCLLASRFPAPALLFLAACATGYQPRGFLGAGYSQERLADDVWLVTFDASAFTPKERVESYLLRRCAELTVEQGSAYFIVLSEGMGRRSAATRPSLIDQPPFPLEAASPQPVPPPTSRSARAAIQLYKEKPEEKCYDAREIAGRLAGAERPK